MGIVMKGVEFHKLKQISVPKGDVWHGLKAEDRGFTGFGEAYFTHIHPGETKGWKKHKFFTLNLIVLKGKVKFVIYDDRPDSNSKGCFEEITLSPENNYGRLTIEPGLWMAFHGESEETSMLMDIIPGSHQPSEAEKKELEEIPYEF